MVFWGGSAPWNLFLDIPFRTDDINLSYPKVYIFDISKTQLIFLWKYNFPHLKIKLLLYIDGMSLIRNMFSEKYQKKLFELVVLSNQM